MPKWHAISFPYKLSKAGLSTSSCFISPTCMVIGSLRYPSTGISTLTAKCASYATRGVCSLICLSFAAMQGLGFMIANPDLKFEKRLWPYFKFIAGLDEAGRGALAGPVAVGAVILPNDKTHLTRTLAGVRDSKQMTPLERESLAPRIQKAALAWSVAFASAQEIDSYGIVEATRLAATRALNS